MTDHRALIEEAGMNHRPNKKIPYRCFECEHMWPCVTARLATALDEQMAALLAEVEAQCDYVSETTRAALRLAAERDTWHADAVARARDQHFIRTDLAAAREELEAEKTHYIEQFGEWAGQVKRLQRALERYGKHHRGCGATFSPKGACTCWLAAELDAAPFSDGSDLVVNLERDLAAARTALERFGRHDWSCGFATAANMGGEASACTCGFLAALTTSPSKAVPCASRGQDPAGGVEVSGE